VSTEYGISLYSRGDGIQARFIPAILNEISKGKKHTIWGFEEPENSYEYRNAEILAKDFLSFYSVKKQVFITSHTKEFLSLISENEDRVSLHRVYKTVEKGSLVESYKKDKGFDKGKIQDTFWEGVGEKRRTLKDSDILNLIFQDIGFLENDQYLIERLQKQLINQRTILERSGLERSKQEKVNKRLTKRIVNVLQDKDSLELEIEEYRKPILFVEDKYDQIYKIAFLKLNSLPCEKSNFEDTFKEKAPFTIRRCEGAGGVAGRLRVKNHDGYEEKKVIGLFDFDKEGRENYHCLHKDSFWDSDNLGNLKSGFYKKRTDHSCFHALLLPIPDDLRHLASLEWEDFVSYVEIENLLPIDFLKKEKSGKMVKFPGGTYFQIKKDIKSKIWKRLFDLNEKEFDNFKPLFDKIFQLFTIKL
jgi:hypothetical protein